MSNMQTFFLEYESDQDQDEALYSARLQEGSVTKADVAVARYLSFLRAQEHSFQDQMESALAYEGSEWFATNEFLDRWQPYSQTGFRPEDNAFLLPEYKTDGIIEAFPKDEGQEYEDANIEEEEKEELTIREDERERQEEEEEETEQAREDGYDSRETEVDSMDEEY